MKASGTLHDHIYCRPAGLSQLLGRIISLILLGLLPGWALFGQHNSASGSAKSKEGFNFERHLEIMDLTQAGPPHFVGNSILFTYREPVINGQEAAPVGAPFQDSTRQVSSTNPLNAKRVSIVFAHEGWRTLHPLTKTNLPAKPVKQAPPAKDKAPVWKEPEEPSGPPVYFLYWELDRELQEELIQQGKNLEYRLVIDGIWMADPQNSLSLRKLNGSLVSYIDLNQAPPPAVISPEIKIPTLASAATLVGMRPEQATLTAMASSRQARTVTLRWVGESGQEVYVAGSFNQFDPWLNPMTAESPDPRHPDKTVYSIELRLLAGQYQYHFVINGQPFLDALNNQHGFDAQGTKYSQVLVP